MGGQLEAPGSGPVSPLQTHCPSAKAPPARRFAMATLSGRALPGPSPPPWASLPHT